MKRLRKLSRKIVIRKLDTVKIISCIYLVSNVSSDRQHDEFWTSQKVNKSANVQPCGMAEGKVMASSW